MKSPNEIIQELHSEQFIERHVQKLSKYYIGKYDAEDLTQYLYLYLLEHEDKLMEVYNKGHLKYYLLMAIKQQVNSKNSWFATHIKTKDEIQAQFNEGHIYPTR